MDIQLLSKRVPNMDVIIPTDDEAMVMNEGKTNLKGHAYDHFNFLQFNTGVSRSDSISNFCQFFGIAL